MNRLSCFVVLLIICFRACGSLEAQSSFQDWQAQHFNAAQLSDPSVSGTNANPAGDGLNNLTKYALGLDPTSASGGGQLTAGFDASGLPNISFPQNTAAADLYYVVETSMDLQHWYRGPDWLVQTGSTSLQGSWQITTMTANNVLLTSSAHVFYRLTILYGNALPTYWLQQYFGTVSGIDPNAMAPNGDGNTILEDYLLGRDPTDWFNGQAPLLDITLGNSQIGPPGTVLPNPVSIIVNDGAYNAPVTVAVSSGGALIATDANGTNGWSTTLQLNTNITAQVANGQSLYVAQAYVLLPNTLGDQSILTVTASTGGQSTTAQTWAMTSDPSLSVPINLLVMAMGNGSVQLSWSSDPSLPTIVQMSLDGGMTWLTLGVLSAGTNIATIQRVPTSISPLFRTLSAAAGTAATGTLDASAPMTDPTAGTSLSVPSSIGSIASNGPLPGAPMLLANQTSVDLFRSGFPGFQDPTARYRSEVQTVTYPNFDGTGNALSGTCTMTYGAIPSTAFTISDPGTISGAWCYNGIPNPAATINSDTSATYQWTDFNGQANATATLSQPWSQSQFVTQATSYLPTFSGVFQDPAGASLFESLSQGTKDDEIAIQNFKYKWQLEASDSGIVAWYVTYTPKGVSTPTAYYTITWDPNGAAGSTSPVCTVDAYNGVVTDTTGNPVTPSGTTGSPLPAGAPGPPGDYAIAVPTMAILQASANPSDGTLIKDSSGNPVLTSTATVNMCRWLGAAPGATNTTDPTTIPQYEDSTAFPANDPDQFVVQFTRLDKTEAGTISVQIYTVDSTGKSEDNPVQLTLTELLDDEGDGTGVFQSNPLALVADHQDATASNTIFGRLDGQICIVSSDLSNKTYNFNIQSHAAEIFVDFLMVPLPAASMDAIIFNSSAKKIEATVTPQNYQQCVDDQMLALIRIYHQIGLLPVCEVIQNPDAPSGVIGNQMNLDMIKNLFTYDEYVDYLMTFYAKYQKPNHILVVLLPAFFQDPNYRDSMGLTPNTSANSPSSGWCFISVPYVIYALASEVSSHEVGHALGLGSAPKHANLDPYAGSLRTKHLPFELMCEGALANEYNQSQPIPFKDTKRFTWDDILMLLGSGVEGDYPCPLAQKFIIPY